MIGPSRLRSRDQDWSVQTSRSPQELANGDLYLVYYGGEGEYASTAVFGSRLRKGSQRWTKPVVIAQDPFRSLGNGVIWQAPDGVVWLFYVVRHGKTWSTSKVQAKISRDHAKTWSDAFPLVEQEGIMVCNRPIVLHNGDYACPSITRRAMTRSSRASTARAFSFDTKLRRSNGNKRAHRRGGWKYSGGGAAVEVSPHHLIAYSRRCGNYESIVNGWVVRSESRDGGWTWTEGKTQRSPIRMRPLTSSSFAVAAFCSSTMTA